MKHSFATYDGKQGEDRYTTQTACEDGREDQIQDSCSRDTLNCLLPCWNVPVPVGQNGQEVGVEAQDDGSTAEDESVQRALQQSQEAALEETHCDGCVVVREGGC